MGNWYNHNYKQLKRCYNSKYTCIPQHLKKYYMYILDEFWDQYINVSKTKYEKTKLVTKYCIYGCLLPPPWIRHFHKIITSGSNYARSFFPGSFRWVHDLSLGKFPAKTVTLTDFHCFGRRKQKKDLKNGCKYSFTNVQMLRYIFEDVFWNCWH